MINVYELENLREYECANIGELCALINSIDCSATDILVADSTMRFYIGQEEDLRINHKRLKPMFEFVGECDTWNALRIKGNE